MIAAVKQVFMKSEQDGASTLTGKSFPAFSSEAVQKLVGVLEVLAEPTGETDSEDIGRQLRSLAVEFSEQSLAPCFLAIMTGIQDPLELNEQANDIFERLHNLAERLNSR